MQLALVSPTWLGCFWELGAETQLRPRCCLQGGKARGGELTRGVGSLFSNFAPCQALGAFCPGDHLHLAVNCSPTVVSCLSQFPYSTHRGISSAAPCPVSEPLSHSGQPNQRLWYYKEVACHFKISGFLTSAGFSLAFDRTLCVLCHWQSAPLS